MEGPPRVRLSFWARVKNSAPRDPPQKLLKVKSLCRSRKVCCRSQPKFHPAPENARREYSWYQEPGVFSR